jgi:acetylornithine deacetylase/succinyl-diaminopimelate desuccinylase-like protein
VRELIEGAAPSGAIVELAYAGGSRPGIVDHTAPPIQIALAALEDTLGVRPLLVRAGGTMPVLATLVDRGLPTIMTGFALIESNVHAPNERLPSEYVPLGIRTVSELFVALGELR